MKALQPILQLTQYRAILQFAAETVEISQDIQDLSQRVPPACFVETMRLRIYK
jgi:hypothetical protein